ncbi:SMI1/KNR4 family protein [Paenibacillus pini]|nr:SMI1/KNR4 family protein [Paenibacillus pini]
MSDDLLAKLDALHEEDEYEEIVDTIMEIPAEDRDYVLISHLGRALSNLERYEEAIEQFLIIAAEGEDDPLWHYRMGLAYYYLEQYDNAQREFNIADTLEPGDEDTLEFLEWIRNKTVQKPIEDFPVELNPELITKFATDSDFANFWEDSEYAFEKYVMAPPTDDLIDSVQQELVFVLPAFYIQMMKVHNGGIPHNRIFPIVGATSEADAVTISAILGIGREKRNSLCGDLGSRHVIENGGYPEIGVVICECPSESGVVMLDYRSSGNDGEPEVVHVGKENHYKITMLAPNFEMFVRGLEKEVV